MNGQIKQHQNERFCRAVQQHPCLYDRSDENYQQREACEQAWNEILETFQGSVNSCKDHWYNIRNTFIRAMRGAAEKDEPVRYYLQDSLEFLIPHIKTDVGQLRDEAKSVKSRRSSTISYNKTERNGAVNALVKEQKTNEGKTNIDKDGTPEIAGEKNDGIKNKDKMENDAAMLKKRSTSARRKVLETKIEDRKNVEKNMGEIRSNRRSVGLRNKVVKNIDAVEEKEQSADETMANKKAQTPNNTIGTFYISPKNSDTGTFFIKKNSDKIERENTRNADNEAVNVDTAINSKDDDSKDDNQAEMADETEETEDSFTTPQHESRSRFKRACKRGLNKKMMEQPQPRQKEVTVKGTRRSAERLKSLAKATRELDESISMPKKETKVTQMQTKTTTPNLDIMQDDETDLEPQQSTTSTATTASQILKSKVAQPLPIKPSDVPQMSENALESQKADTSTIAVQCNLDPTETDDDFLCTLKPYFNDMNLRQKLHFKKKIFESLMEVFDSAGSLPCSDKEKLPAATSPAPAIIPTQLKTVSGEEVRLVRELVAIVQAAKQMPELNLNASGATESISEVVVETQPTLPPPVPMSAKKSPPPLTIRDVTTLNSSVQSSTATGVMVPAGLQVSRSTLSSNVTPSVSTITPVFATSMPLTSTAGSTSQPLVQRRIIRKLVKVNDLEQGNYSIVEPSPSAHATQATYATQATHAIPPPTNGDAQQRRILRIFPKSSLCSTNLENAVTSSGVGTFVVPRSTTDVTASIGSPRNKVVTTAATSSTARAPSTTQNQRQFVTPVTKIGWAPPSIASSQNTNVTIRNGIVTGGRPMRRYSVCGTLPNVTVERHTATANTNGAISAPKATIGCRGSSASFITKDVFKLPTPLRSNAVTITAATTSTAVTNTTASISMPALSVTVADRQSTARTMPLTMGFNRFLRNDGQLVGASEVKLPAKQIFTQDSNKSRKSPSSTNFNTSSARGSILVNSGGGVKRSLGSVDNSVEKRVCTDMLKISNVATVGGNMAGIIASDNFAVLNIKSEPIDVDF